MDAPLIPNEDFINMHRASVSDQLLQEGNEFAAAFVNVPAATNSRRTLNEELFRNVFFPMFLDLFTGGDNPLGPQSESTNQYGVQLGNWVGYAGSVNAEVDVVDALGNVLFTVPSVYDNSNVSPTITGKGALNGEQLPSLSYVVKQFRLYANSVPVEGQRYISEELSKRAMIMSGDNNQGLIDRAKAWNKIFEFYNKPPLVKLADQPSTTVATPDNGEPDYEFVAP